MLIFWIQGGYFAYLLLEIWDTLLFRSASINISL